MKKKYVYFIVPLLGLAIFSAYYWNFSKGYDAEQDRKAAVKAAAILQKATEQEQARLKAAQDAIAVQEKRKKEKEEQKAIELARTKALQDAAQDRDRAQSLNNENHRQVYKLEGEVKALKEEIEKLDRKEKENEAEKAFVNQYIVKAQANLTSLTAVVDKIIKADAETARQAAIKATQHTN